MTHRTYLVLCMSLVACSRSSSRPADSVFAGDHDPVATSSSTVAPAASAKGSPCPRTGLWALCSLEKRLSQAGFVVRPVTGETPRRAGFGVAPAAYILGHSRLEVFVYPDEAALSKDIAGLDTLTASPRGKLSAWVGARTFVRSANLAAVFLTDSPVQAERLTLAITAGPPQPN